MGCVYEAIHEAIERRVAIKVLHPEYARNSEFTARFFNESVQTPLPNNQRRQLANIDSQGTNREGRQGRASPR
jgi:serine/threonine protein kinase